MFGLDEWVAGFGGGSALARRQGDRLSVHQHLAAHGVDAKAPAVEAQLRHQGRARRLGAAQNRPGPDHELAGTDRLGQVVVRPEIEAFDTGHLWFAKQLVEEGLIEDPVLIQLCMGIPWGAPDDLNTFMAMVNNVPANWTFSAFSIGRNALAYPAAAILAGGNVRVGLEDNLYIGKGQLATNGQLVEKAVGVIEGMGAKIIGPKEVREKLKLTKR